MPPYDPVKPKKDYSAGSMLLQRLEDLRQNLADFDMSRSPGWAENIFPGLGAAEAQGQNIFDIMDQPRGPVKEALGQGARALAQPLLETPFADFGANVRGAEAQGLNLFDILSQGGLLDPRAGVPSGGEGIPFEGGPLPTGPGGGLPAIPNPQDVQGFNVFDMLGQPNMSLGEAAQSALELWPLPIMKTGEMIASGLGYGSEEGQGAEPQFDLAAAQARMGQMTPTPGMGPGSVGVGQTAPPDQGGLGVLSQVLGPAAVLPAPVQEPLPPELNLAPVREQFMQGRPQAQPSAVPDYLPTPEGDLQSLENSYRLQGLAEGGLSGASAPIGEMLLRMGLGGVSGIGQGMQAREKMEAIDREQMMALREEDRARRGAEEQERSKFERDLAGLDLSIAETELAADVARNNAIGGNLDRQYQHALAQAKLGTPQYLGMSSAGPVVMSTKDGQQSISVVQTPTSEVDRMSAFADLVTAEAKLAEAGGKGGGVVDPKMAGHSMYLSQVGNELIQTGGYAQLFEEDEMADLMEEVNNRMGTEQKMIGKDEDIDKKFNRVLISTIVQKLQANPDLIPRAGQFSTTAAQLSMAEELASGGAR